MFRSLKTALFCIPALFFIPASAQETATAKDTPLTVDQIVEKHTQALGGIDKLKAIQSVIVNGKAVVTAGPSQIEAPIVMKIKRPGSMHMEMTIQGQSYVQGF